jgi:hypothetical protein
MKRRKKTGSGIKAKILSSNKEDVLRGFAFKWLFLEDSIEKALYDENGNEPESPLRLSSLRVCSCFQPLCDERDEDVDERWARPDPPFDFVPLTVGLLFSLGYGPLLPDNSPNFEGEDRAEELSDLLLQFLDFQSFQLQEHINGIAEEEEEE